MIVLGMGSGTSLDGIDLAAVEFAREGSVLIATVLATDSVPYAEPVRASLEAAAGTAPVTMADVCRIDTGIGQAFASAAAAFLAGPVSEVLAGTARTPELVASHGQTLWHDVVAGTAGTAGTTILGTAVSGTLQLGQPAWIAEATGLPVISDLRVADVAAGGQGAPLAATLDALWLGAGAAPVAALNLGGIANVSIVRPGGEVLAFDTGPANALLDAAVTERTGGRARADVGGALAARGRVDEELLTVLLAEPYYAAAPPKTTGKELFGAAHVAAALRELAPREVITEDLLATLAELTARTVADALAPYGVTEVVASGGGTHNPFLMDRLGCALGTALGEAPVRTSTDLGLDPDAKEAVLFALLGWLTWHGLPGTVPSATGARGARIAGRITPGRGPLRLPEPLSAPPTALRFAAS